MSKQLQDKKPNLDVNAAAGRQTLFRGQNSYRTANFTWKSKQLQDSKLYLKVKAAARTTNLT